MAQTKTKTPKSPRFSLPWAIEKMLILLEKEGLHPVAPDIMAQHLGYTNSKSGQAATVLGTLRMYGLIKKGPQRKDLISEDVRKFKYTPDINEKRQLVDNWLRAPKIFSSILQKYTSQLPSDAAFRYELIQDQGFTEDAANKFIKIFKDSMEFRESFGSIEETEEGENEGDGLESEGSSEEQSNPNDSIKNNKLKSGNDENTSFSIQISGPGMNSTIEIKEEDDLLIVEAMLNKVRKKLENIENEPSN